MTKVYELPNGHRMIADIDETTRTCTITETQLDSLVSKLNYYAEQTEVLDKIRAEINDIEEGISSYHNDRPWVFKDEVLEIIDKYREER